MTGWRDTSWTVVRWMVWESDTEPSPGVVYEGDQDGARHVYDRYAQAGVDVELRYQAPPVTPPVEIIATTRLASPSEGQHERGGAS